MILTRAYMCQYVISRSSIKTHGQIELVFGIKSSYCGARGNLDVSKMEVIPTGTVSQTPKHTRTHTYTHLMALFPGLPRWTGTIKVKPIWLLLKQQTVSGSGISWAICKSASRSTQITTPAPHHSVFLLAGCPSCRPTNSVKALKAPKQTLDLKDVCHGTQTITMLTTYYDKGGHSLW